MNTVLNKEQKVDARESYTSCTDEHGIIVTVNDAFVTLSGYEKDELLGKNHNILRHPDMPKVIFDILWKKLEHNKKFVGLIKNRAKDGTYFWLFNEISTMSKKGAQSKVYYAYKQAASKRAIFHIGNLYKKLLDHERSGGIDASYQYLEEFLSFRGVTYDEYIETMASTKGLFKGSLYVTRKLFT